MINSSIATKVLRSFTAYIEATPAMLVLKLRPAHLKQFEDLESNTGTISTGGGKKKLLSRRSAWNKQDDWAMQKDNDGRISTKTPVKKSSEQSRKRAKLESRLMVRPFTRAGSTSDDSTLVSRIKT